MQSSNSDAHLVIVQFVKIRTVFSGTVNTDCPSQVSQSALEKVFYKFSGTRQYQYDYLPN